MKYLLDTNVMIHLMNNMQPLSGNVMSHNLNELTISGFTAAELAFGVENSSPEMKERNRLARAALIAPFQQIYHDDSITQSYGKIKAYLVQNKIYSPKNEFDILIAATAIAKDLTLVTQNVRDFEKIPSLKIEDWSK